MDDSNKFEFVIDFVRGEGGASRVLLAANDFVRMCEKLDRELVKSVHTGIETEVVLDDIQSGSLKLLMRSVVRGVPDEAIRDLDWKKLVGSYLVVAKWKFLEWADDPSAPAKLAEIRRELQIAAAETEVRHLPDYSPPSPTAIIQALQDFQAVKERLAPGDRAFYRSSLGSHEVDKGVHFSDDEIERLAVRETITQPPATMLLLVKRPDYLGKARWDLRHGKRPLQALIADEDWLTRFQGRQIDVRPGDALKCRVEVEMLYGFDNELISERFRVVEVIEVLRDQVHQFDLLSEEDGTD